jgi:serine/threonine protein kinase/Tol biopolymer transport system component
MIGETLGRYSVVEKLGEGGMGVVYRAHDSVLNRDIALKVLRNPIAADPIRMERFRREAQVLAALNHPNIASIYGIEAHEGSYALVMELVEGATLSDRLARGPIPLREALAITRQIADALEYAHERGIIHRDLKPSNIKVSAEGSIKVLDFGLAKAAASPSTGDEPTLSVRDITGVGRLIGTPAYMSPEQARGLPVDKRTDIWAIGVVLFEVLTGRHAFGRSTSSDTIAAVLEHDPEWSALPAGTPQAVRRLLRHCLQKDLKLRLHDIGDARIEIDEALDDKSQDQPSCEPARATPLWKQPAIWVLLAIAVTSLGAAIWFWRKPPPLRNQVYLSIPLPPGEQLTGPPAISADGRIVAFTSRTGTGRPMLHLRDLSSPEVRVVPGTEEAMLPFFSPDGEYVAFFARGHLIKAAVSDGSLTTLAVAPDPWGGTWGEDGSIIFVPMFSSGLVRLWLHNGTPEVLTKPDEAAGGYAHMYPQFLPDGRHVVFSLWAPTPEHSGTALLSLETGRWQLIVPELSEVNFPGPGFLVIGDHGVGLRVVALDAAHPVTGQVGPTVLNQPIAFPVDVSRSWFAVSTTGTLVYAPADFSRSSLVWVDRSGHIDPVTREQRDYWQPALSPDGGRIVVRIGRDLWLHDLKRSSWNRLTFSGYNAYPVWTHDGRGIVYSSNQGGDLDIYLLSVTGTGSPTRLLQRPSLQVPCSVAPDGTVGFVETQATSRDIWVLSPDQKLSPFLTTPFYEGMCRFSPDGRYIAYTSDESGRREVYVQPFPGPGEKVAISTNGGTYPVWSRDGSELFFRQGDAMMVVDVKTSPVFSASRERQLFASTDFGFRIDFDVSADGKHFLMVHRDPGSWPTQLQVVLNWFDEVHRTETSH